MDSLTQLALGAAVGEAVLGRQVGRKAIAWGALCGTLPDLDVFIPLGDAVSNFTYHRGVSHSLFFLAALSPVVVWLILKLHPTAASFRRRWFVLVYLAFATHILLDAFTVYGTQLFWPFDPTPIAWSTIFIIDPLYTLPLLVGVGSALVMRDVTPRGHLLNILGLGVSTAYLAWSLAAKIHVERIAQRSLGEQNIKTTGLLTTPSPFNTLLWRIVAMTEDGYLEGLYSLLDEHPRIRFAYFPSEKSVLNGIEAYWPVQRLKWFTKGFYRVQRRGQDVVISDLRMGLEPEYVFRFKVGRAGKPYSTPVPNVQLPPIRNFGRLGALWKRIWTPDQPLSQPEG